MQIQLTLLGTAAVILEIGSLEKEFAAAGLAGRVRWLPLGKAADVEI